MKMNTEGDKKYHVELHYQNLDWLKTYLKTSGLEFEKNKTLLFGDGKKDEESFELLATAKQLYKFISDLMPNKSVKVTCNKNGTLKDYEINGFNEKDTLSILTSIQTIYISDKRDKD